MKTGTNNPCEFQERDGTISKGHVVYYPAQNPIDFKKAEVFINNKGEDYPNGEYHTFPISYIKFNN